MEIKEILDLLMTICSGLFMIIFIIQYCSFLSRNGHGKLRRVNINAGMFIFYFVIRFFADLLFYLAFKKDPSVIYKGTSLEKGANVISTIFSRLKWVFIYYVVARAEDARIETLDNFN